MPWAFYGLAVLLILLLGVAYEEDARLGNADVIIIVVCLVCAAWTWLYAPYRDDDDDDDDFPEVPPHVPTEWDRAHTPRDGAPSPTEPPQRPADR